MAAIRVARDLEATGRESTAEDRAVLAQWSSWGAIPQVFDATNESWAAERAELRGLLTEPEWLAARRTTINAHYTDPKIAAAMWEALTDLGFTEGRVLEPGCGSGVFIGTSPESVQMVGVELDPLTAAITRGLYPGAEVRTESFADTRLPAAGFDAAIGNVPFGGVVLHDPTHNPGKFSLHNHFIVKSLDGLHPGGIGVFITSRFTMDQASAEARKAMHERADLLGAVRLPTGAHRRTAGTEALTDVLIFRRREADKPVPQYADWIELAPLAAEAAPDYPTGPSRVTTIPANVYWELHPERVLGTLRVGHGMHGEATLAVVGEDLDAVPALLREQLRAIVGQASRAGLTYADHQVEDRAAAEVEYTDLWDGTIVWTQGGFKTASQGVLEPLPVPKAHHVEMRSLLDLRDGAKALLEAEAAGVAEDTLTADRQALRARYASHVEKYGALNRYSLRLTGRTDPDTGEERTARMVPATTRLIRKDPLGPLVLALEVFDDTTQSAAPAALLSRRVVHPRQIAEKASTPEEAIALCMEDRGFVDPQTVADLLGVEVEQARAQLTGLAFKDPDNPDRLIYAPEYLAGDIGAKLDRAMELVETDPTYQEHVDALRGVLPDPVPVEQIHARMGAVWIDAQTHEQFLQELLNNHSIKVEEGLPGRWNISGGRSWSVAESNEWGTERRPATSIAAAVMSQQMITVQDEIEGSDGRTRLVLNPVETEAANEKATAMQERFSEWVWADPERATRLGREYNRRFNSIVLRDYAEMGERLSLPGLAANFEPRPHQRAAVARIVSEPAVGLFHQVGAGKTAEMVMGAMELRRMGLANKPCVVIPNHMLEQFTREWLQLYPQARILAASTDDLSGEKRRLFVARAATSEWDAVLMTQGAFFRIPVTPEFESDYLAQQISDLRESLERAKDSNASRRTVKQIETACIRVEEQHKRLLDKPADHGISWEETGIDYLMVDEAHMFKNLATTGAGAGSIAGSQKASDLHMKLEYLRSRHGGRVVTAATATPLANSVTEAYVMQKYLRPDLLESAGIKAFDQWASTFGETVTEIEVDPAGQFRTKARFARFTNVPEMMMMWNVFADVKTHEDLNLPVPLIAARSDGKREPETVVIKPSSELLDYIADIARRAEDVANRRVHPSEDNMLRISTHGRRAAVDLNLVRPPSEALDSGEPVKLDVVADKIAEVWQATKDRVYIDTVTGEPSPIPGGLQLVFCDLGTPGGSDWNVYTSLRERLAERGMNPERVRFIHEAKNDVEKARMFAAARAGHMDVLIGSTAKMGVGTNVQARCVGLHHVECPWRPADIEQREGRAIRQGNQNEEVRLFRYVVEQSFDSYTWQTVARKAVFINQVMSGQVGREIEDIGSFAISASEAKALASGNPLLLEKAESDALVQKLSRAETAHRRGQAALAHALDSAKDRIEVLTEQLARLREAEPRTVPVAGDDFLMKIDGVTYTERARAADALTVWAASQGLAWAPYDQRGQAPRVMAEVGGHEVTIAVRPVRLGGAGTRSYEIGLKDLAVPTVTVSPSHLGDQARGLVTVMENRSQSVRSTIVKVEGELAECHRTVESGAPRLGQTFPRQAELEAARARAEEINDAIREATRDTAQEEQPDQPQTPTDAATTQVEGGGLSAAELDELRALREASNPPPSQHRPVVQPDTPAPRTSRELPREPFDEGR